MTAWPAARPSGGFEGSGQPVTRRIAVVSAGLGQPSATRLLADRLADAAGRELAAAGAPAQVDVVDLRAIAHQVTDNLLTGFPAADLRAVIETVTTADGLIAVSPVFQASYSGLFKSFFDVLEADSIAGMPVLIGATGGSARHSLVLDHALRPLFTHLRAVVVPTGVYAATGDFGMGDFGAGGVGVGDAGTVRADPFQQRIDRAAAELAREILAGARRGAADPFDSPTPFADLLAGLG